MGQKVHPIGIRLGKGKIRNPISNWFPPTSQSFADLLKSDREIREFMMKRLPDGSSISDILIKRTGKNIIITIRTAKPGVVIGKKGEDIEKLRMALSKKMDASLTIKIDEVRKPELEATLVAESVAQQLEKRIMFRRAMKRAVQNALRQGAEGIKISVSGRLGGAEIARTEWYREGRVPLHTFRADIDYSTAIARTTYGIIGVKVWIFRGEVLGQKDEAPATEAAQA